MQGVSVTTALQVVRGPRSAVAGTMPDTRYRVFDDDNSLGAPRAVALNRVLLPRKAACGKAARRSTVGQANVLVAVSGPHVSTPLPPAGAHWLVNAPPGALGRPQTTKNCQSSAQGPLATPATGQCPLSACPVAAANSP